MLKLKANESGPSTDYAIVGGWSISDNAGPVPADRTVSVEFCSITIKIAPNVYCKKSISSTWDFHVTRTRRTVNNAGAGGAKLYRTVHC